MKKARVFIGEPVALIDSEWFTVKNTKVFADREKTTCFYRETDHIEKGWAIHSAKHAAFVLSYLQTHSSLYK